MICDRRMEIPTRRGARKGQTLDHAVSASSEVVMGLSDRDDLVSSAEQKGRQGVDREEVDMFVQFDKAEKWKRPVQLKTE